MPCLTGQFAYKIENSDKAPGEVWTDDVQTLPADVNGVYYIQVGSDWDPKDPSATWTLNVYYGGLGGTLVTSFSQSYGDSSFSTSFVYDGPTNGDLTIEVTGQGIANLFYKGDCTALPTPSDPTPIFEETCFDVMPVCKCPTFLRWLDSAGGWRYWLFQYKKKTTLEASRGPVQDIYEPLLSARDTVQQIVSSEANELISLNAKFLDAWQFEYLKSIAYAPQVFLLTNPDDWQTDGAEWRGVLVDGEQFVKDCDAGKQEAELIIRLPSINTVKHSV
jgi:hypothetical protein